MKLRHEINLMNRTFDGVAFDGSDVGWPLNYAHNLDFDFEDGVTCYFEIVAKNASGSTAYDVTLAEINYTNLSGTPNTVATISVPANTSDWTRIRSTSFTNENNYIPYCYSVISANSNISVQAARVLMYQDGGIAPNQVDQAVEIGDYETGLASLTAIPLANPKYWYYDSSKFDGTVDCWAEVSWIGSNDKYGASIVIQEDNGSFGGWTTVATIASAIESEVMRTDILNNRTTKVMFTPTNGRNYRLAVFSSSTMQEITIFSAKLHIRQTTAEVEWWCPDIITTYHKSLDGTGINWCLGQSFTTIGAITLKEIWFMVRNVIAGDDLWAEIAVTAIDGDVIANGTSELIDFDSIDYEYHWIKFTFDTGPSLAAATEYFIRVKRTDSPPDGDYDFYYDANSDYADGDLYPGATGETWGSPLVDSTYFFQVYGETRISKLESVMLLQNSESAVTGLKGYNQLWDEEEWSGVTLTVFPEHDASGSGSNTKLQEDVDGTPSDVTDSSITGANRVIGGTALSITDDEEIDTYLVAA